MNDLNRIYFFGEQSPLSNWHRVAFTVKNVRFTSMEQYMMFAKAKLFGDETIACAILKTDSPREQKRLGREVKDFNQSIWVAKREYIVTQGLMAKFSQNPALSQYLLDTKDAELVEASPYDYIWGAGLAANDSRIDNKAAWPGLNLLGILLMHVRSKLPHPEVPHLIP